ncbi:hypothetical protein tb265_21680 [Gemmatimonadetes bacterium T265]|nr:hypothetical protein tb265_21680 [Gemmatimonadetes bacterium T265]
MNRRYTHVFRASPAVAAVIGALILAVGPAGAQDRALPSVSAPRVAAQLGTGLLLGPVGYVGGGLATRYVARRLGASPGTASTAAERAGYVGIATATAVGPTLIGARAAGHGNYFASLGGATAGMFGSALVARLNRPPADAPDPPCRLVCRLSAVAAFALPSIGATVGYNLSRRR